MESVSLILQEPNQLWLGDLATAQNKQWIKQNKIGCVITVANGQPVTYQNNIIHHYYFIDDKPDFKIQKYFSKVFKDIDKALLQTNILIHCAAGISRSPTFVIGYLISRKQLSFKDAYHYVKQKRPKIKPNEGFLSVLQSYVH